MAEPKYPTQREKVEELAKKIEAGTKEFMQSDKYRTYLRTMSKFHSYSFRNCLLIAMQKPDATLVAGYQAWQKKFERQVGRGEKGIRIFAPVPYEEQVEKQKRDSNGNLLYSSDGKPVTEEVTEKRLSFRVTTVFDVSQTSGKPLPELATELDGSVEQYEMLFQAIRDTSEAPIMVETFPAGNEAKGYYSPSDHSIHVRDDISEVQSIKTVLHELAHSVLHNKDAEEAAEKSRMTMEVEAESVAFIVSDHFGIDTSDYSFAYLASWSSGADLPELHQSLDTIQKTANDLIQKVSARYQELAQAAQQENVPHMAQEGSAVSETQDLRRVMIEHNAVKEHEIFTEFVKQYSADQIVAASHEISTKNDFVFYIQNYMDDLQLTETQENALMTDPNLLDTMYSVWMDNGEWSSMEDIGSCMKETANYRIETVRVQAEQLDADKFYVDPTTETVRWMYYNPDSSEGGQIVCNDLTFTQIREAFTKPDPMEHLHMAADQISCDITDRFFMTVATDFLSSGETFAVAANDTAEILKQLKAAVAVSVAEQVPQEAVPHMAQSAEEKSPKKAFLGNTAYRDISDKAFVVVAAEQTAAVMQGLEEQNIPYCCKVGDARGDVFTVSREYLQQLMELKKAAGQATGEQPPHKQKPQPEITIIGNAPYRDIPDKAYVRVDAAAVDAIIQALEDAGVKYSGKLDPAKGNVITVPKEHKAMVEGIQKRTASMLSDQPRQQFMKVTEEQLKALQAEDTPLQVRKSGSAYIISFAATEKARIDSALQALELNQKVKR